MLPSWFISALGAAAVAVASPVEKRASSFSLYAYGTGLSGLRLFTSDGQAYVGDYSLLDDDEAAPVLFTKNSDGTLTGNPDSSVTSSATWSDLTYYVASPKVSNHTVGFTKSASNTTDMITEFTFYGAWIAIEDKSGTLETLWYVTPTDTDGVYSLKWNATSDSSDEQITIALTKTAPSN